MPAMSDRYAEAEEAAKKLKSYDSWAIFCHENPDGDTLGSAFALYSLGVRTGKKVSITCRHRLPETYSFFPYSDKLEVGYDVPVERVRGALLVAVDISIKSRAASNMDELLSACVDSLTIDHHVDNELFAKLNFVDPEASATAELITALFEVYGAGMTPEEAAAIYTALVTDNGNFRFNSTTPESHRCAEVLLRAGAKPADIDDAISENMTDKVLRLWGIALSRTEVFADGKCALFSLRSPEIEEARAFGSALDGLVNMLLRIKGIKIALFLTERRDGSGCKLSVRSRGEYNARAIASRFGGGGHTSAAGAKVELRFDEALASVRKEAEAYVALGNTASK